MQRRTISPAEVGAQDFYKLLTASIVPRPIAWVSTRSADGIDNLAPHSFFTVSCVAPPVIQFTSVGRKDSLNNVEATGEFAVSVCPASMFEQINATATDFPPELSEFEAVGVDPEPGREISVPGVRDSPVILECRHRESISFGNSTVVFGDVVLAAIDPAVIGERDLPAVELIDPVARLGKIEWSELGKVRQITRIPHGEWPGHYEPPEADRDD